MNKKVLSMANDSVAWYLRNFNVIGIEYEKDSSWFYAIGKYENSNQVNVLSVAKKDSGCKTTVFGDFNYFAILYALHACGYSAKWTAKGYVMWPVWYLNRFEMQNFLIEYDKIISKYGFDRLSVERNTYLS